MILDFWKQTYKLPLVANVHLLIHPGLEDDQVSFYSSRSDWTAFSFFSFSLAGLFSPRPPHADHVGGVWTKKDGPKVGLKELKVTNQDGKRGQSEEMMLYNE